MRYRVLGVEKMYAGDKPYAYLPFESDDIKDIKEYIISRQGIKSGFGIYAYIDQKTGKFYNGGDVELDKYGKIIR